jgi:hypothetical protein
MNAWPCAHLPDTCSSHGEPTAPADRMTSRRQCTTWVAALRSAYGLPNTHAHTCPYKRTYTYTHIHAYIYTGTHRVHTHTYMRTHTHAHTEYIHTHTCAHIHRHAQSTYTHIRAHIYTCTHIHRYSHMRTYTQGCTQPEPFRTIHSQQQRNAMRFCMCSLNALAHRGTAATS